MINEVVWPNDLEIISGFLLGDTIRLPDAPINGSGGS
jgi:hypothetical protein